MTTLPAEQGDRKIVALNGRDYRWPSRTSVVVCFDGCDPDYIAAASAAGLVPTLDRMRRDGFAEIALAAMPTTTNTNNVSIVCGVPPAIHGVSGNYYIDRATGEEIMMLDDRPMTAETILSAFSQEGAAVVAITAKDKLRKALARNLRGIAFSSQHADETTMGEHGIIDVPGLVGRAVPDQYSEDLSLYVLDAGIALVAAKRPDLVYLSLSDYVQHKHAPGTPEADAFMVAVDERLAKLLDLGAVVGVVADHGMSDMSTAEGTPNVIYVGDRLEDAFGRGCAKVICPIADPFVRHHGALGGFVRVHMQRPDLDPAEVAAFLKGIDGIDDALLAQEACSRFDLPMDKEGDVAVIAHKGVALGARAADHDLSALAGKRLRSHGGLAEQPVPFLVSHPLDAAFTARARAGTLRNYDIFDAVLNGVEA
ncbi:phosphonoacetate hydrolase [Angulomicrobium tetraedrale]|uniref:Phosphonoacetate hydrolase n=1 Tax=Ancylobacter tetraedralis TaxID=217068 RepID=A0A839ZFZ7_9HYPH|nr:phosphonoacetate hydrolase [Ancylobacter tetraedralis]MBB3773763.1 phosphonoacetate hydrolase [Ancylobacter tetraedralis]